MKCPEGTVEVSVWKHTIYFDGEKKATNACTAKKILRCSDVYYEEIREALSPIMNLGHNWVCDGEEVHLFDPDVFELLTKGVGE